MLIARADAADLAVHVVVRVPDDAGRLEGIAGAGNPRRALGKQGLSRHDKKAVQKYHCRDKCDSVNGG